MKTAAAPAPTTDAHKLDPTVSVYPLASAEHMPRCASCGHPRSMLAVHLGDRTPTTTLCARCAGLLALRIAQARARSC